MLTNLSVIRCLLVFDDLMNSVDDLHSQQWVIFLYSLALSTVLVYNTWIPLSEFTFCWPFCTRVSSKFHLTTLSSMYAAITNLLVRHCFMDEWVNLQYRITTNLFRGWLLTHNYFQVRESQSLVQLLFYSMSTWSHSTSTSPPSYKTMSSLFHTNFLAEK